MKLLLDTHALLWAAGDRHELSARASDLLSQDQHTWYVSAVSSWEIATKFRIGKLPEAAELISEFELKLSTAGYKMLSINCQHGLVAGGFAQKHRDPFDRLLVAQCLIEDLILVSSDKALDAFGIRRIW